MSSTRTHGIVRLEPDDLGPRSPRRRTETGVVIHSMRLRRIYEPMLRDTGDTND